jgi:hypothetical protein
MSHTAPFGEAERQRQTENRFNAVIRHCRIGKVKFKASYPRHPFDLLPPYKAGSPSIWPFDRQQPVQWWQNPVVSTCATSHTH